MYRTAEGPWLTVPEAAARGRAGESTILRALATEELHGEQRVKGGKWRIHVDELDAWVRGEVADVNVPAVTRRRRAP